MNHITGVISKMSRTRTPAQDEYVNPADNLLYCKNCNTPRQANIRLQGWDEPFCPPVMCKCQRERFEQNESETASRKLQEKVRRLKSAGLQDRALYSYTFENDSGCTSQMWKARKYVENFAALEADGEGLLLWGEVGSGKTYMAGCIANALLDQGIPVMMTNFSRILLRLTSNISEDRNRFLDELDHYRLLVIDDLGIERNSEFALEQVFGVIDRRCQSNRPMIITTNLTLAQMKEPADLPHARIYDRVLERCLPIRVSGNKIRQQNAAEHFNGLRKLFGDQK